MPTKREREYYRMGFQDGVAQFGGGNVAPGRVQGRGGVIVPLGTEEIREFAQIKRKRKLSAWNKYVKANSKKPRFRYRNGKLNLKKMAIAFRKTPAGRKKRR